MLLYYSLIIFTVVAVLGLLNAANALGGKERSSTLALLHGLLSLAGSAIVIYAFLTGGAGDKPVIINIIMAVVIIVLGIAISLSRHSGKAPSKGLIFGHTGLAVACYLILAAFTFNLA
jgi:hypothetical protein